MVSTRVNLGRIDRVIRFTIAIVLLGASIIATNPLIQAILFVAAVVAAVTGALRFCPAYALLGLSSCRVPSGSRGPTVA